MKPGYKQTEVGVIPEDWEVKPLGEVGGVKMCKRVLKHQTREHGDVPFYKIGTFGGVADAYISRSLFNEFRRKYSFPNKGDILISAAGTIGRTVVYDGAPAYFQDSNIVWIENDESKVTNAYLLHCYEVTEWAVSHGGTVARLYNDSLRTKIHIPVPTLAEQEAIAGALSDADALIDSLEQLIAKKRLLKQGAMQDLLTGKKRLPGFEGEWEVKTLSDFGRCYRGVSYNPDSDLSSHETNSTVRLLRANNIQESQLEFVDMQFVTQHRVSPDQYLRKNDILICMANGSKRLVGKAAKCPDLPDGAYTFGAFMGCFRPNPDAGDERFVAKIFYTKAYRQHIDLLLAGSSINNLTPKSVESVEILVPADKAEQTAIAAILSDMDAEIAALEAKLAKARQVKQGMMQELLTGKTRLL